MRYKPLEARDWELLAVLTTEYETARTLAARVDGVTEEEIRLGDRSSQVASQLRKLHSHGLIERDYHPDNIARCIYAVSERGLRELELRPTIRLMGQAA